MREIAAHLWYDREAEEAARFYVSVFERGSGLHSLTTLHDTPSGSVELVSFELLGRAFMAISAGPLFRFNPSVSFHVNCTTKEEVDAIWARLSAEGTVLMELGAYPFSERYGWVQDRYGLSWQIAYAGSATAKPGITPMVMFVGEVYGRAEEAISYWTSVFPDSAIGIIERFGPNEAPDREGAIKHASFSLLGQEFSAIESAHTHAFAFSEAISFLVRCETQEEIDYYWQRLSADPAAEQCGWLKDRFGLSWQIVPSQMDELLAGDDEGKIARVSQAVLQMKKLDLAALERAARGG